VLPLSEDCCGAAHIWQSGKSENSIGLQFRQNKDADWAEGPTTDVALDTARRRLAGAQQVRRISGRIDPRRHRLGLMISAMARSVRPVAIRPWRSIALNTAPSVMRAASSHVRRTATRSGKCAKRVIRELCQQIRRTRIGRSSMIDIRVGHEYP
jgi:hypothetical protein